MEEPKQETSPAKIVAYVGADLAKVVASLCESGGWVEKPKMRQAIGQALDRVASDIEIAAALQARGATTAQRSGGTRIWVGVHLRSDT